MEPSELFGPQRVQVGFEPFSINRKCIVIKQYLGRFLSHLFQYSYIPYKVRLNL